ncbi:MAG TPA: hypothetical protein VHR18_09870 [Solirubrobacterales bacterium]|jgi:hypothetical protein|nr:hypothetical protein [Solirubrobacterales bacterium]
MSLETELVKMARAAAASPETDSRARQMQGFLARALTGSLEGARGIAYGSLARGTHVDPIRDVDVLLVLEPGDGPDRIGSDHDPERVLGVLEQKIAAATRDTIWRGSTSIGAHSVKCFPGGRTGQRPVTFADVVPAVPTAADSFLIPDLPQKRWVETNPSVLMNRVRERQAEWEHFIPLVRLLKRWNAANGEPIKSLAIEVLAIEAMEPASPPRALADFFAAGSSLASRSLLDPAGLCGRIDPGGDFAHAELIFQRASRLARQAVDWPADEARSIQLFQQVFDPPHSQARRISA